MAVRQLPGHLNLIRQYMPLLPVAIRIDPVMAAVRLSGGPGQAFSDGRTEKFTQPVAANLIWQTSKSISAIFKTPALLLT